MTTTTSRHDLLSLAARDLENISGVERQLETVQKEFEQLRSQLNELFDYFGSESSVVGDVPLVFGPPLRWGTTQAPF